MPIVPVDRNKRAASALPTDEPDSYQVGYGKPPRHSRFQPGQSGNPKGRPKNARGFKTIIRTAMLHRVRVRTGGRERMISRAEALVMKLIELASRDNPKAIERLLGWFQEAVPEAPQRDSPPPSHEDLSDTDHATLEALRQRIRADLDQ